jgi:hypothetical protein
MPSSASIYVPSYGYTYTFTGVLSVKHEYSLKLQTDSSSAAGEDYINGARNQPDKVILSVVETDIGHQAGWANRMLQAMESIKRNRYLCTLVTSALTYTGMLLSGLSVTVDGKSQGGWQGTLTFTQYRTTAAVKKTNDNSSAITHTGSAGTARTVSGTELAQMLARAGVEE